MVLLCLLCSTFPLFGLPFFFFFFNVPAPTEIYTFPYTTLFRSVQRVRSLLQKQIDKLFDNFDVLATAGQSSAAALLKDRKSTRLNSSHVSISYAVFCLKKKMLLPRR